MKLIDKKIFKLLLLVSALLLPFNFVGAAMQSTHYVIYENVLHTFDGPVISNVNSSVNVAEVTVTWDTTGILSDSFVVYDTNASFATSKEQGTSVKNAINHSVLLKGLSEGTSYYYYVKSTRVNGGVSTSSTSTFTTGTTPVTPTTTSSPGGGMLIIDKTDKAAPIISELTFKLLNSTTVEVRWKTNEKSTSFIEYGETVNYGSTFGSWDSATDHVVVLDNLLPFTAYHFRALSSDSWGNVGYSEDKTFTTNPADAEAGEKEPTVIDQKILEEVSRRTLEFLQKLFPEVSLNQLGPSPFTTISSIDQILRFIPAPVLSGEPGMTIGAKQATIKWTTDIDANSMVALAAEGDYNAKASEPYAQIIGNPDIFEKNHEVRLMGLTPNTLYHIQLRSKAKLGPTAKSKDFTFRTITEELEITSYFTQVVDPQTVIFKWVTNKDADSAVKFTPYFNNVLAVDQSKIIKDNAASVIHEIKVSELLGGMVYEIELVSSDKENNTATKLLPNFSTGKDETPPEVTKIKAESTVFLDKKDKTQTVISWTTDEPATSKIYYQEGVHGGGTTLSEWTGLSENYNKEHVIVITKFKPGTVYTFRVESADSAGNLTLSQPHTFMTAKQKESIIQVIMRVLENTFGWMKQIGN